LSEFGPGHPIPFTQGLPDALFASGASTIIIDHTALVFEEEVPIPLQLFQYLIDGCKDNPHVESISISHGFVVAVPGTNLQGTADQRRDIAVARLIDALRGNPNLVTLEGNVLAPLVQGSDSLFAKLNDNRAHKSLPPVPRL
jgi:hypothetical protein